jgi:hypothetical protein
MQIDFSNPWMSANGRTFSMAGDQIRHVADDQEKQQLLSYHSFGV